MSDKVQWLSYEFTVYQQSVQWNNVGGIYIFAGLNQQNQWVPYYIGKADSFANRIPSHEQWDKARSLGATHVHARTVEQEAERDRIEPELIRKFQPRLNTQLR
jgi:excinuclease UvrABC nuclease subunit